MFIGALYMKLHLPDSNSLKDKRQIIRSLLSRARNEFSVAAAEVHSQDLWEIAELGFSYVSSTESHAREVLLHLEEFIVEARPDLPILESALDIFTL